MTTATPSKPPVNTKTAPKRDLRFASWDEMLAEIDRVTDAVRAGPVGRTGNWSVGQIARHCGQFMQCGFDGFSFTAPAPLRFVVRTLLLKRALGPKPVPSGWKLPSSATDLLPPDAVGDLDGLAFLREQAGRVERGERFTHPSPIFGHLTHEQWCTIHRKHVAMHFGFIALG